MVPRTADLRAASIEITSFLDQATTIHPTPNKDQCRQFTDNVYNILPRELRDSVFSFLWDSSTTRKLLQQEWRWEFPCSGQDCTHFHNKNEAHFMLPGYVRDEFAVEAAVAFYHQVNIRFDPIKNDIIFLKAVLQNDWFHRGLTPGEHLQSFSVFVSSLNLFPFLQSQHISRPQLHNVMSGSKINKIKESLNVFTKISLKPAFKLTVIIEENDSIGRVESVLEVLRHEFDGIRSFHINVVMLGVEYYASRMRSLTDFYSMSEVEWNAKDHSLDWTYMDPAGEFQPTPWSRIMTKVHESIFGSRS